MSVDLLRVSWSLESWLVWLDGVQCKHTIPGFNVVVLQLQIINKFENDKIRGTQEQAK